MSTSITEALKGIDTKTFTEYSTPMFKPLVNIEKDFNPNTSGGLTGIVANPNYIFTKEVKLSGMPFGYTTQQMRYHVAKKGDTFFGILETGPKGQFIRGVVGGLKVQVPIDAVEPISLGKKSNLPSPKSSSLNIKEAATWGLGFSALFVFLKWAKLI